MASVIVQKFLTFSGYGVINAVVVCMLRAEDVKTIKLLTKSKAFGSLTRSDTKAKLDLFSAVDLTVTSMYVDLMGRVFLQALDIRNCACCKNAKVI